MRGENLTKPYQDAETGPSKPEKQTARKRGCCAPAGRTTGARVRIAHA